MGSIKSRKSFLIDSLLEERQKKLASTTSSSNEGTSSRNETSSFQNRESSDENGNDRPKMPSSLMDEALAAATVGDEDQERNTSTRSPDSPSESPIQQSFSTNSLLSTPNTTNASTLQAMAASVASSPFLRLFSKFINQQGENTPGTAWNEENNITRNNLTLAQSIEYYNRLRLISSANSLTPPTTNINSWPNAQNFLAAAAFASANQSTSSTNKSPFESRRKSINPLESHMNSKIQLPTMSSTIASITNCLKPSTETPTTQNLPTSLQSTLSQQLANSAQIGLTNNNLHPALRGLFLSHGPNALPAALAALSSINKGSEKRIERSEKLLDKSKSKVRPGRLENTSSTGQSKGRTSNGTTRSSNVKKYRCDVCEKTFSRSNTLITHKRIHTGEKPFRCEHCNRAFRQPGNLTRHRLTHTTVKPFVCPECDKAFNRASNLHTHMRTHLHASNWTPTICSLCGKAFGDKSELKTHVCEHGTANNE